MTGTDTAFEGIADILVTEFGIPRENIEPGDYLADDWGLDLNEQSRFTRKLCDKFGVSFIPEGCRTVADYVALVT